MEHTLASKYCESLGMSVILCRVEGKDEFRCLSSHLCGGQTCNENQTQMQKTLALGMDVT